MQKYDIFNNNCNHFSNFCAEVLVGNGIPQEILNQANEFKNTPIGNMLQGFQVNPSGNTQSYDLNAPPQRQVGGTGMQGGTGNIAKVASNNTGKARLLI